MTPDEARRLAVLEVKVAALLEALGLEAEIREREDPAAAAFQRFRSRMRKQQETARA